MLISQMFVLYAENNMERTTSTELEQVDDIDVIITGDWHLRLDQPVCRLDNYAETQWKKVDFISELQRKYNCPVIHSGDLFDNWKPSPELLALTVQHLPAQFWTVYGNHDLPQHAYDLRHKSGIHLLEVAKKINVFTNGHWGTELKLLSEDDARYFPSKEIGVFHIGVYNKELPYPGCADPSAVQLLKKYSTAKLIVTGDNHKPFVVLHEGRLLVNPGSIMRMDADQINHTPRVYLWNASWNIVTPVYLPISTEVISAAHIEVKTQRDERISAFIEQLNGDFQLSMSFDENLKRFEQKNEIRSSVMSLVYKAIEVEQ